MHVCSVVAVLSTGRCGTQWLASGLSDLYPDVDVAHEPIGPLYAPRRYFRRYDDPEAILEIPEVARHIRDIEQNQRAYVETGWPLFPALPLLAARLPGRLRIVHLTRHPIPSALSHMVHKSYAGSAREDAYTRLATLAPCDPGVFAPECAEAWGHLSAYEKCLFWWTEVHRFGLELPRRLPQVPMLRIKSESMLGGDVDALRQLLSFIELPWDDRWLDLTGRVVDRWHHHTDEDVDPLEIHRHPGTIRVARALGYDMTGLNLAELRSRYRGTPDPGLDRIGRFEAAAGESRGAESLRTG